MRRRSSTHPAVSVRDAIADLAPARPLIVENRSLLRTARLTLRPLRESDREEYLRVIRLSREHLDRFSPLHRPGESDDDLFLRQLDLTETGDRNGTAWRRIGVLDDGRIAGAFNLNAIRRGLCLEADANWWIAANCARLGLAFEGVRAMLDFAFMDLPRGLGLHRVFAGIQPENEASLRMAARLGFVRVGGGVSSYLHAGGRWERHDVYVADALGQVREISE
ncbi:MAG: GNAT family N-acetyltransferase [Phycisphaeraceae bacterium]|nr:GNAT family N-acetyltransferase [Phycisphaeraceae bacterium]